MRYETERMQMYRQNIAYLTTLGLSKYLADTLVDNEVFTVANFMALKPRKAVELVGMPGVKAVYKCLHSQGHKF